MKLALQDFYFCSNVVRGHAAKPEYYYGVHSVESLLELEPERVLTLFTLKGRDDQRLQKILQLAEPFGISVQKASRDSLEKLAGLPFHQGVVAAVRPHPTLNEKDLTSSWLKLQMPYCWH